MKLLRMVVAMLVVGIGTGSVALAITAVQLSEDMNAGRVIVMAYVFALQVGAGLLALRWALR